MPTLTLSLLLLLLVSPAVGSFLSVLVDRLPRDEDVVRAASACRSCGQRLRLRDLIPVLSFLLARGRCRMCGAPIPAWNLYVEIAAPGLAVLALFAGGAPVQIWITALLLWTLLALAVTDLIWFRLPDPLTFALFVLALVLAGLDPARSLPEAGLGALFGAGSFWLIRVAYALVRGREGLGLGDVKLMAGIGALGGALALPATVLIAAMLALALALGAALRANRSLRATARLPFGAALCAAAALTWLAQVAAI